VAAQSHRSVVRMVVSFIELRAAAAPPYDVDFKDCGSVGQ